MKDKKYLCGMLFLGLLLIIQITSCGGGGDAVPPVVITPGAPFITSDISGVWHIFATNGASNNGTAAGTIGGIAGLPRVPRRGNPRRLSGMGRFEAFPGQRGLFRVPPHRERRARGDGPLWRGYQHQQAIYSL